MKSKLQVLRENLKKKEKLVVAFSGGVDSSFLLKVAKEVLQDNLLAVTSVSQIHPESEIVQAVRFARSLKVRHVLINTKELSNYKFIANNKQRCYFCKRELFKKIKEIAEKNGFSKIADGTTLSDRSDFRPGAKARKEFKVYSPLEEAGFTKEDVRRCAKKLKLKIWNKPAESCLATRIPCGKKINRFIIKRISQAERFLSQMGVMPLRIRDYGNFCRLETEPCNFLQILRLRQKIIKRLKTLGYHFITLDLEGYRKGIMNFPL